MPPGFFSICGFRCFCPAASGLMAASSSEEFFGYAYAQISSFDFVRLLHEKLMHHLTALFTTQDDEHVAYSEYHSTNLTSNQGGVTASCQRFTMNLFSASRQTATPRRTRKSLAIRMLRQVHFTFSFFLKRESHASFNRIFSSRRDDEHNS